MSELPEDIRTAMLALCDQNERLIDKYNSAVKDAQLLFAVFLLGGFVLGIVACRLVHD